MSRARNAISRVTTMQAADVNAGAGAQTRRGQRQIVSLAAGQCWAPGPRKLFADAEAADRAQRDHAADVKARS